MLRVCAIGAPFISPRQQDCWDLIPDNNISLSIISPTAWRWDPNRIHFSDKVNYIYLPCKNQDAANYYFDKTQLTASVGEQDIIFCMSELFQKQTEVSVEIANNIGAKKILFAWDNINSHKDNYLWKELDGFVGGNLQACEFAKFNGINHDNILFCPQAGINTDTFIDYGHRAELEKIGWINILFAARFTEGKGCSEVIAAMREIFSRQYDVKPMITFAGFVNDIGKDLTQEVKKFEAEFPGMVRVASHRVPYGLMSKIYNDSHIIIGNAKDTPYWREQSMSYSLGEAAACGCAVIVSDAGALNDYWNNSGALIIKQSNTNELISAIDHFVKNKEAREHSAFTVKKFIIDNYSNISVALKFRNFFRRICE